MSTIIRYDVREDSWYACVDVDGNIFVRQLNPEQSLHARTIEDIRRTGKHEFPDWFFSQLFPDVNLPVSYSYYVDNEPVIS